MLTLNMEHFRRAITLTTYSWLLSDWSSLQIDGLGRFKSFIQINVSSEPSDEEIVETVGFTINSR